jgi:uncharacterized protein (TIGR03083 family)
VLDRDTCLTSLERDSASFAKILRTADLATPVPDCPGWTLRDLASHLGGVHRWAHDIVVSGAPGDEPEGPRDRDPLIAWFVQGAAQLLTVLRDADPAAPTWTFGPRPRLVSFWVRRQSHETSMHLQDARRAVGEGYVVDPYFAADGVDEVVTVMFPRQVRLQRIEPLSRGVRIELSDVPGASWVLAGDGTDRTAGSVATVRGTAEELLRALWGRKGAQTLTVEGDADAALEAFAVALTP